MTLNVAVMDYPKFIETTAFLEMDSSLPELDQYKAMLANLTRIHLLTANHYDSFDDLIGEYLQAGVEIFGMETGIVSRIDNDSYVVCDVVSPLEVLEKNLEFALEDTYCREVVKSQCVLGFPEVGKLDYMNCHPVYQNLKLEAYLSAPIYVDGKLFGTLNFTSVNKREQGFSHHEHDMILLMGNAIGAFISLRKKEDKLKSLNEKVRRFVGYVAHDLRNPIGGIIGLSRIIAKSNAPKARILQVNERILSSAEHALNIVSTILDNAAISTGKLLLQKSDEPLKPLLVEAVNGVQQFADEADIQFSVVSDDVNIHCDRNRILQGLTNLLVNAVKYAPEGSEVLIESSLIKKDLKGSDCEIKVANLLGSQECQKQAKNALYQSVGFGLDIVRDVLSAHGADMVVDKGSDTFTVSFILPSE